MSNLPAVAQIAERLHDVAAMVRQEAEEATATLRAIAAHAQEIAAIAAAVDTLASSIEVVVTRQEEVLRAAQKLSGEGMPMIDALVDSARGIADMATLVASIAGRSRVLALNARIEAARADASGSGFAAVAGEMTALSQQSWTASRDIEERSAAVGTEVVQAHAAFSAGAQVLDEHAALIGEVAGLSYDQRIEAARVAQLTGETAARVNDAAAQIGRVASAAMTVDVIARQLTRSALPIAA